MTRSSFDDLLAKVNELPLSEQQKLQDILNSKLLLEPGLKPRDRRVPLIVEDADFTCEMKWLSEHRREYAGQWVALKDDRLIASGASASEVYAASDAAGVDSPLVTRVDDPAAGPFAGV